MTDPMQAALTEDVMRLTQERDELEERVARLKRENEKWARVVPEQAVERDSLSGQVHRLAAQLAEEQIRSGELQRQVAQLEKERDMAYHAYDKLREEFLALTFEPVAPQLEDTFPEVVSGAGDSTPTSILVPFEGTYSEPNSKG